LTFIKLTMTTKEEISSDLQEVIVQSPQPPETPIALAPAVLETPIAVAPVTPETPIAVVPAVLETPVTVVPVVPAAPVTPVAVAPVTPETPVKQQPDVILNEVIEKEVSGIVVGQVKWFNDKYGYGFITINDGPDKGKDIFVHHSGIKPANSNYKTLRKGEYVNFNIVKGLNGLQAIDITGINGGPLMCDIVMGSRKLGDSYEGGYHQPPPPPPRFQRNTENGEEHRTQQNGWKTVPIIKNGPVKTTVKPVKNYNKYNKATRNVPPAAQNGSV
jgi:cold shock CspA family protein